MTDTTSNVIVVAHINGHFRKFFENLQAKKDKFSLVLVVGNLFGDPKAVDDTQARDLQDLIDGAIPVPIATYFTIGSYNLPQTVAKKLGDSLHGTGTGSVCENLYWFERRTSLKPLGKATPVRVVSIAASMDDTFSDGPHRGEFGQADLKELQGAAYPDILLTNEWPNGVRQGSNIDFRGTAKEHELVAQITQALKPRYHFSSSDRFFEREPYWFEANEETNGLYPHTRFISLAPYDNTFSPKEKAVYGVVIDPTTSSPDQKLPNSTPSPWAPSKKRSMVFNDAHNTRKGSKKHKSVPRATYDDSQCFFCISNEGVPQHLLTCFGPQTYVTIARGPLPTPGMFPELGFPGHMLLIPHAHTPTLAAMPEAERNGVYSQLLDYRNAINQLLKTRAGEKYGSVTWETSKISWPHAHWQYIPVPVNYIRQGLVEWAFKTHAENLHWAPKFEKDDIGDGHGINSDYFRIFIWDPSEPEGQHKSLVIRFNDEIKFPAQTGREVLAKLLELDDRVDWRDCAQNEEDETKDAEAFRRAIKEFDPYP